MTRYFKILVFIALSFFSMLPFGVVNGAVIEMRGVKIVYEEQSDGSIFLSHVYNNNKNGVELVIDNTKEVITINAGDDKPLKQAAKKFVKFGLKKPGEILLELWRFNPVAASSSHAKADEPVTVEKSKKGEESSKKEGEKKSNKEERFESGNNYGSVDVARSGKSDEIPAIESMNRDPFFGQDAVNEFVARTEALAQGLASATDKSQFMADYDVTAFMSLTQTELNRKRGEISYIAKQIVGAEGSKDTAMLSLVEETLNNRLNQREQAFLKLKEQVDMVSDESPFSDFLGDKIVNYSIIGGAILLIMIWIIVVVRSRKRKRRAKRSGGKTAYQARMKEEDAHDGNPAIVVRRRTTSILKRQSLEDVVGNPSYMEIDSSDFAPDSAVRKIYIKNTCIKEIYNLYADDLRDSDNPKEDGCMVLGRWVFDDVTRMYDISLETVVMPGDDAVFKEYELNFGGKIKLRIAERLRKLRRETNLQYDLVCWIHSHPGLGVFFSNSDENVQMQLKHPQHPNFLIAFVVDILTSDQEMGIFTFRKGGSMNSKNDLTRMYSLEEMYKWALESDKLSFNQDNHYDILGRAMLKETGCRGIFLDNSSIIDLIRLTETPDSGLAGWAIGTSADMDSGKAFIVSSVVNRENRQSVGVMGALLIVSHFSLPTIQRLVNGAAPSLRFVMVYSSKQQTLTSIPLNNGTVVTDDRYYSEEHVDDLKIWTRRKR